MHKKHILLILVILLMLTGCTEKNKLPANSTNTVPSHNNTNDSNTAPEDPPKQNIQKPKEPTTKSAVNKDDDPTEDDQTPTKNPEKTLTEILNELSELDELMNGA